MLVETDYRALAHAGQDGLPLYLGGGVVAIGNFDGVHRGHQALLAEAKALAGPLKAPMIVLTFSPHPRRFFQHNLPPFLLTDSVLRAENLTAAGADAVLQLQFDGVLAGVSPSEFIDNVLRNALQAKHIVVGNNFVFGKDRQGDTGYLQQAGLVAGFGVTAMPVVIEDGVRISSQGVRDAIEQGRMGAAEGLLGHPWVVRGKIVRGDQRGRTIGFPTANMILGQFKHPKYGVYAANVIIEGQEDRHLAVVNVGSRPTFEGGAPLLEAHLFDFTGDLYGKTLRVALREFLRAEKKFMGVAELKAQIEKDASDARQILARLATL